MTIQPLVDLENWYKDVDPWNYESSIDDKKRKDILLHYLPKIQYANVLDIGCGHGYITRYLPGKKVTGVDISVGAIKQAKKLSPKSSDGTTIQYVASDMYDLVHQKEKYDLIIITGVLYPQYIGNSNNLIYQIIDNLLTKNGVLVSVHISEWYSSHFPYVLTKSATYGYRDYNHLLEIYRKV